MKSIIFLLLMTVMGLQLTAQPLSPGKRGMVNEGSTDSMALIKKSLKLQTAGWICLGTGAGALIGGLVIYETNKNGEWLDELNTIPGIFLMVAGGALVITGVALLASSSKYRKLAAGASVFIRQQAFPVAQGASLAMHGVPVIGLRIQF